MSNIEILTVESGARVSICVLPFCIRMQEKLRDEHRMQLEYTAKMNADEEKKKAELRKMQQRQVGKLS